MKHPLEEDELILDRVREVFSRPKPKFPWRSVILNGIGALVTLGIMLLILWYS